MWHRRKEAEPEAAAEMGGEEDVGLGEAGWAGLIERWAIAQVPWWVISVTLHVLTIALLGLIAWTVKQETIVALETICAPWCDHTPLLPVQDFRSPVNPTSPFDSPIPIPATWKDAPNPGDILVTPEMLDVAGLGKWQTNNPELPDTGGAHGVPESRIFYLPEGRVDTAGGGGQGGSVLDGLIGLGLGVSPGEGGGFGGGKGTGTGLGVGPGGGTFGRPDEAGRRVVVIKHGGTPGASGTEGAVRRALAWLARNQEPDGHWDARKLESGEKTDTACTGLALLAFLGAGHTEKVGDHKENVRRAVAWLKSQQTAEGLIFDGSDAGAHRGIGYPHAIAGMALVEAAGMGRIPETVAAAQRAVDYTAQKHQNGGGYDKRGFRYHAGQDGDLSVTGWYVMQLKSARVAGLRVDHTAFEGIIKFLESVERKGDGGDKGYGPASVYGYRPDDPHENTAHRLTAIGNLCRLFLGWKPQDVQASVQWFMDKGGVPAAWGASQTDLYYWYYGTLCAFQQGGDVWKKWNTAMKRTLVDNQRRGGGEDGSWDPVGDFAGEWGRVGQTALACMCLEVYYRYPLMYR